MSGWGRRIGLVAAAAGLVLLLAGLSFALIDGGLGWPATPLLLFGLALILAYVVVDPSLVLDLARDRRAHLGALSVITTALLIGVLALANVLVSRGVQSVDLTRARVYSLAPQSVLVTKRLDSDLLITGFFRPDEQTTKRSAQVLLAEYQRVSPNVKVRFVDPDQDAAEAQRLGVTIAGSLVLQYKERAPVVLNLDQEAETDVTGAIIRLESNRTPVLCWAAGDGERDPTDSSNNQGYGAAAALLKSSNYAVQQVLLAQQGVPASCDVLVLLGLSRQLPDASITAVQSYLAGGGKLLIGMDPWMDANVLASANNVLKPYDASFGGGLVVENDPSHRDSQDPTIPVVYSFANSPITSALQNKQVFLPQSTLLQSPTTGSAVATSLASSTDQSYVVAQQRQDITEVATDRKGPFTLVQSLEQQVVGGRTARIIMLGTSGLAENETMPPTASTSNPDLFLASLDWLSQQDDIIAIPPKPASAGQLVLTDSDTRLNYLLTIGLLPLVVVAAGVLVLRRRRRVRRE